MRKYRCQIYMAHADKLVSEWRAKADGQPVIASNDIDIRATLRDCATALDAALRKDQHTLYHDAEFFDGCDICDEEKRLYS